MLQVKLDDNIIQVKPGTTVQELLDKHNKTFWLPFEIPQMKYIPNPKCALVNIVEINGQIVPAPMLKALLVRSNMEIKTKSPLIEEKLKERLDLLKNNECYLIKKMQEMIAVEAENAGFIKYEERAKWQFEPWYSLPAFWHNPNTCIRCESCVVTCRDTQGVAALSFDPEKGVLLADEARCTRCGQCIHACPMGKEAGVTTVFKKHFGCEPCPYARPYASIREIDDTEKVLEALQDKDKFVVVQFAPALRASIGEEFGMPPGTLVTGKLYAALRRVGFDRIWDTNFAADLTIMEEGTEFIVRLIKAGLLDRQFLPFEIEAEILGEVETALPQFTSCSPGWVKFLETFYPDLIPHVSSAKSPQQMFGAMAKTYAAERLGIDPRNMVVVSLMPCTAKKYESKREEMTDAFRYWLSQGKVKEDEKFYDVDYVLTTRETARLLKMCHIDLKDMPEEGPDPLLGQYTGAATIFGRTGGVMEAALRTVYEIVTGKTLPKLEFEELGTLNGVKTASLKINGKKLRVAVVHGLANARRVCEDVKKGGEFSEYAFIEFMACPGGCIGGGGQPIPTNLETIKARIAALNTDDQQHEIRKSHENPEIKQAYTEFLKHPLSHVAHELLHTHYINRAKDLKDPRPLNVPQQEQTETRDFLHS
ncbi:[FeFe] hydrogenase, group A [Thermodesulfatator atlanticus]|uniref:[FeFe] hydrogenase, group A n=1 Tax=Thermodesulfatator atlanticus TaxID=501497 RepID=UPI0003B6139F|nr:[FeFe] hydrogenase, group A [Thermodesulfatator atlanticus]